ncbi:dynamin family protein [Acidovorax sp. CCYZU-2555]|uniref:dynamin family protein n=1 Tax=Acidovorax sp. CCYZU-2555 TaxID=2835042 RepID=UPI001BD19C0D|nr:dynamin family protein [Acidovorax sp. CCYZU-2555]MBS7780104.1 dynamin family protein [Acidovorax sp. CCYZU-2555]
MTLEQRVEQLASRIQKLNDVIAQEKYQDLIRGMRQHTPDSQENKDSDPRSVDELRQKFKADIQEGGRLRVGIIGRVKAGKSSLLNALLFDGKEVLPKAATPMTASLTVLGYSATPYAEVEFFGQDDIENMRERALDYDWEFELRVKERLEKTQARVPRLGGRAVPAAPDPERIKAAVRRELDDDPALGGSKKLFDDIQSAGGRPPKAPLRIEGKETRALLGKLGDYVGAQGKFTPFTKCMSIYLPLEALKNLEVVDTPGVNDPIVSREKRTFDELHKCHAVFVVSPSGQFLNQQDLNLMQRLVKQDGVEEVFLVASQIDSQMFSSVHEQHKGCLPDVLKALHDTLAQQARQTLPAPQEGSKGLDTLKHELDSRLVVTSSVAYTLSKQPEATWDDNARHIHGMLRHSYQAEFAQSMEAARPHFDSIAGIVQTHALLDQVRGRRQSIIEGNLQSFLDAQENVLQQRLKQIPEFLWKQRETVEASDEKMLEQQLQTIGQLSVTGARVVDTAVSAVAKDIASRLHQHMDKGVNTVLCELRNVTEKAKSTEINTYRVDSDGASGSLKRGFGWLLRQDDWGTERRTETVGTVNATAIRTGLDRVHADLSKNLIAPLNVARRTLRSELEKRILGELRSSKDVNDHDIDITILAHSCQSALRYLRGFDDPTLPALPDELLQSGSLKGSAAERYVATAKKYFASLQIAANKAAKEITEAFKDRLGSAKIGALLFEGCQDEIQKLQQKIKEKQLTLQRYDSLLAELKDLK